MEQTTVKPEAAPQSSSPSKPVVKPPKPRKKRKWVRRLIILAVIVLVLAFAFWKLNSAGQQVLSAAYIPAAASLGDITVSVSSTGTVQPIDSYKVTALVKGEILEAPFEEGGTVEKGALLYRIDSKDVENSISRSNLAVEQSRLSYNELAKNKGDAQKNLDIKANATGVVQKVYCKEGDTVAAGSAIADILDRDNMLLTVPFHSVDAAGFSVGQAASVAVDGAFAPLQGTVDSIAVSDSTGQGGTLVREVTIKVPNPGALSESSTGTASIGAADCAASGPFKYAAQKTVTAKTSGEIASLTVAEGDSVTENQSLGAFKAADTDAQIENARLSLQSAELSLQAAKDQLENYTITSPISGTVIEKNFKAGDNIDATSATGAASMAVIYDMSTLTFEMKINELDINKIQVGQTVQITAAALEGQTFTGHVDKININGTTTGSTTSYPVTVVIDQPGDLLPGMNVSAEIVTEQVKNVLTVPVEAVDRGGADGPTVTVAPPGALNADGTMVADASKLETRQVKLGKNDAANIEILSGLQEGDVVVYKNQYSNAMAMMMGG